MLTCRHLLLVWRRHGINVSEFKRKKKDQPWSRNNDSDNDCMYRNKGSTTYIDVKDLLTSNHLLLQFFTHKYNHCICMCIYKCVSFRDL